MTIDEAIEILTIAPGQASYFLTEERRKALALGIAALKVIQKKRTTMSFHPGDLLPGETKD